MLNDGKLLKFRAMLTKYIEGIETQREISCIADELKKPYFDPYSIIDYIEGKQDNAMYF